MQLIQTLKTTVSGDDDRGVSPVIGVILMVAITVILAAVIATFVLGLGEQVSSTAPQANFDMDVDSSSGNDILTVSHQGGGTIDRGDIAISVGGARAYTGEQSGGTAGTGWTVNTDFSTEIEAGVQLEIQKDSAPGTATGTEEVEVLYLPEEGSTATLANQELEFSS